MNRPKVFCVGCGGEIYNDGSLAGQTIECPNCHQQFVMPGGPPPPPAPSLMPPLPPPVAVEQAVVEQPASDGMPVIDTSSSVPVTQYYPEQEQEQVNGFAVIQLIGGILGLVFFVAVILGQVGGSGPSGTTEYNTAYNAAKAFGTQDSNNGESRDPDYWWLEWAPGQGIRRGSSTYGESAKGFAAGYDSGFYGHK